MGFAVGSNRTRKFKLGLFAITVGSTSMWYYQYLNEKHKRQLHITIGGFSRFFRSARVGAAISWDYWWSLRKIDDDSPEYLNIIGKVHQRSAERILDGCLKNGGLYIKLGQGLVNMDHVLPKQYTQTLKVLQDKCLVRKQNEVEQIFEEDFGISHTEIFKTFDEEPIAAASLAQVFTATIEDGTKVAVKTQYIDLRDRFSGDIKTIKFLLKFIASIFPKYDFQWVINQLHGPLEKELNFILEGRNSETCATDLAHLGYVYVPKVYWDKSSERILTTEFIDGIKVNETEKLLEDKFSLVDIDNKLISTFAEQIFHTGFIHADPHPGNILIRKANDGSAQVVLLDHGLYEVFSEKNRKSLSNLWKAIVLNNHTNMKTFASELGVDETEYRLFCMAISQRYVPPEKLSDDDIFKIFFTMRGRSFKAALKELSVEDRIKVQKVAEDMHDKLFNLFKKIPNSMILISRNLNAIRSIVKIHGDQVDRHKIMAQCAAKGTFDTKEDDSFIVKSKSFLENIYFIIRLWIDGIIRSVAGYLLKPFENILDSPSSKNDDNTEEKSEVSVNSIHPAQNKSVLLYVASRFLRSLQILISYLFGLLCAFL